MKRTASILIALLLLGENAAWAKKINFSDLPEPVQKAIVQQKLGDEKGLTIREETDQGKTIYKVALKREGKDVKLEIATDGRVTRDSRNDQDYAFNEGILTSPDGSVSAALGKSEKLRLGDTPVAVQTAVKTEVTDASNARVKTGMKDGQTVYHVEIDDAGKNVKLTLNENGAILKDNRKDSLAAKTGLKKLALSELPPAVQNTIRAQTTAEIDGIKSEKQNGRTVYKVEFKQAGKNAHLWVTEDGSIVKDEREAAGTTFEEKAGAEPAPITPAPVPTTGLTTQTKRNLTLSDVPKAVQETITTQKGDTTAEGISITKRTSNGQTFYEVQFQKEGKDTKLHIAEDGGILPEKK